jgi:hypothetical protein
MFKHRGQLKMFGYELVCSRHDLKVSKVFNLDTMLNHEIEILINQMEKQGFICEILKQ